MPLNGGFKDRLSSRIVEKYKPVRRSLLRAHRNTYQCYTRRLNVQRTCYAKQGDEGHELAIEVEKNTLEVLGVLLKDVWNTTVPMGNQIAMESMYSELNHDEVEDHVDDEPDSDEDDPLPAAAAPAPREDEFDLDALIDENIRLYQSRMRMAATVITNRAMHERAMMDLRIVVPDFRLVQTVKMSDQDTEDFYWLLNVMDELIKIMRELLRPSVIYLMEAHGSRPFYDDRDGELVRLVDSLYQSTVTVNSYLDTLKNGRRVIIVDRLDVDGADPYKLRVIDRDIRAVIDQADRTVRLMTSVLLLVGTAPNAALINKVSPTTYDELIVDVEKELVTIENAIPKPAPKKKDKSKKKSTSKKNKKKRK